MTSRTLLATSLAAAAIIGLATAAKSSALAGPPAEPPTYRPVTSDVMNAYIQPRHTKLFLAGEARNWDYAEYERHNIGGALARWAQAVPTYKGQSVAAMIAAFATPQLAQLETAIKSKDPGTFAAAYAGLTEGCNQCHQATGHAFVAMKAPPPAAAGPFPDQEFAPAAD